MSGLTNLAFIIVLCLAFDSVLCQDSTIHIETEAGKTFDALCPAKHYVSGVTVIRENIVGNQTDFRFSVQCQPFLGGVVNDVGEETCTVLLPIPMLNYDLSFDDYEYNCDCNEYLAGIRSEHFGRAWDGFKGPERRIQLICCRARGVRINNGVCGYTGMESLIGAPWKEASFGSGTSNSTGKRAAIQGLILSDNYVNSRVCLIESVPLTTDPLLIGDCYEYGDCASASASASASTGVNNVIRSQRAATGNLASDAQLCFNRQNEPFGWTENMAYMSGGSMGSYRSSQWYKKQEFVCRHGHRITSVSMNKRKAEGNHTDADYVFSAQCSSTDKVSACYCYWMSSCPSETKDLAGVWYVGGIRSWFENRSRKMELLCCLSNGIKSNICSKESVNGSKSTFSQKVDLNPGGSVGFIRNIETAYTGNNMSMQITTCGGVLTGDWCVDDYDSQCRRCKRRTRQSQRQRQLPDANGNGGGMGAGNNNGNGNGATNAYYYTDRGSSGWGPLWYNRPAYTQTVTTGNANSNGNGGQGHHGGGTGGGGGGNGTKHHGGNGGNTGGGHGGSNGGHHTVPAPVACSFTPKCGSNCPASIRLPVHGHGGRGNNPNQLGLVGPPAASRASGPGQPGNAQPGGPNQPQGSRSINDYHAGQGRGGNPVGPPVQQGPDNPPPVNPPPHPPRPGQNLANFAQAARMAGSFFQLGRAAAGLAQVARVAPAVINVAPAALHAIPLSLVGKK